METVLITGCSSGIGRATAHRFNDADWQVYATARERSDIDDLADAGCETLALDVRSNTDISNAIEQIHAAVDRLDCLVNNAGYAQFGPLEDLEPNELAHQFDVNVVGPHRLIKAVLPKMRTATTGTIINISSTAGRVSFPGGGAYAGSKFAIEAISDALRAEVAEFDIDVILIEPGPVDTKFTSRATDELTPDSNRTPAYAALYSLIDDSRLIGGGGPFAVQPDAIAEVILNAATTTQPKARYPVGPVARWAVRARFLPDHWRDTILRLVTRIAT